MHARKRPRTRASSGSSKRKILLCVLLVIFLAYFAMISRFLSSEESTPSNLDIVKQRGDYHSIPPLHDLVQGWNITGNVSFLMDFAIVGFPKTGTSSLMFYLEQYKSSIYTFKDERCELAWNQHVRLINDMYPQYSPQRRMGIKCPGNLEVDLALSNYHDIFPTTKFIVGLRHPIPWFESFYNFRVTNLFPMPPAETLVGKCFKPNRGVCTNRAKFSEHLQKIEPWRKVFIYHVDQLQENSGGPTFRKDLGNFLEVYKPLATPMLWVKPGKKGLDLDTQKEIDSKKIDICNKRYEHLREILLQQAIVSSDWIQNHFLNQENVVVSNRAEFERLLETWNLDPCAK